MNLYRPLIFFITAIFVNTGFAQSDGDALETIVSPGIERRDISESRLDSEDFEIGIYGGLLNVEEFDSNPVYGARLAYHMTEDISLEFNYGSSTVGKTSFETLGGDVQLLAGEDRSYTYYSFNLVYNILPGEVFIGKNTAYNTGFYLLAGVGNTTFNSDDFFTYSLGGGLRFYLTDWMALHATVKDHIFNSDVVTPQVTNNIESTLGLSFYF